jgi:hypothetical protein
VIHNRVTALTCRILLAPGLAGGQSPDPAAERARLGNERIEAERRAREELEQQEQAPPPSGQVAAATTATSPAPAKAAPAAPQRPLTDAERTEQGLGQLRELGKLKDAGYLTEAEFQRVKQKILDSHF